MNSCAAHTGRVLMTEVTSGEEPRLTRRPRSREEANTCVLASWLQMVPLMDINLWRDVGMITTVLLRSHFSTKLSETSESMKTSLESVTHSSVPHQPTIPPTQKKRSHAHACMCCTAPQSEIDWLQRLF